MGNQEEPTTPNPGHISEGARLSAEAFVNQVDALVAATVVGTSVETALQPGELAYDILDSGSTLVLMMASDDGVTPVFAGGPANGAVSWRVKVAGSGCVLSSGARPVNALGEGAVCAPPEGLEGSGDGYSEGGVLM
jgi:hypothetical protein